MALRDRMYELTAVEEVDEFLQEFPTSAFFKAGTCHKTMQGFGYVEEALNPRENIHLGFVKVVQFRPVSNYIAELTKVVHQSPQLILMVNKKPVYDVDNWNITPEALTSALNQHLGKVEGSARCAHHEEPSLEPYTRLLERFIQQEISEKEFAHQWLLLFQNDSSPRSTQQFALLNSLYGDVDAVLSHALSGPQGAVLYQKADLLLKQLK